MRPPFAYTTKDPFDGEKGWRKAFIAWEMPDGSQHFLFVFAPDKAQLDKRLYREQLRVWDCGAAVSVVVTTSFGATRKVST